MRGIPPADISAVFREGKSGPFPNPYLTEGQLLELSALCLQTNRVIRNVEAFGITKPTRRASSSVFTATVQEARPTLGGNVRAARMRRSSSWSPTFAPNLIA